MTINQRLGALALVAVLGVSGAACGGNSDDDSKSSNTSLVENGDQQGSGGDGSIPDENRPGNTPGGRDAGDQPTGDNSGQDKP